MLVPLMFSPDLEGTSKTSESQPETIFKPQLHTQKNHNSYNGTRTLPIATRVRPLHKPTSNYDSRPQDKDDQKLESNRILTEEESPLYEITLYYPHNRACTIYRSRQDFWLLRTGLSSRSSSSAPQRLSTPPSHNIAKCEDDSKEVAKWDSLLRKGLERFAKNGHGRYSVEWFLRRRLGDCERMASGKGTGLPAGTTRRVKIKPPRDMDGTKTTDERSGKQEDKGENSDRSNQEAAATEGKCQHDRNKDQEDNVISEESQTDNESEVGNGECVEEQETRYNKGEQPDQGRNEVDDQADDRPKAARPMANLYTEVPVMCPLKPMSEIRQLDGSSIAKRRKHKQNIENAGRVDQKTIHHNSCDEDAEISTLDSIIIEADAREESSSDGTVMLTPTSTSAGDTWPGDPPSNPALMYMLMFSRRASDSDWGQKILGLLEQDDSGANTL
ncbi:hypothetical protein QBC32DRAFT_366485 [Pseudoneurospora amorphoporcata]|uniref:Uncharacterized protein n=1 Tax=Pseudoneurospora amorphoporcata TaxID=241081 RepID=A0AAN6P7G2_9PEZI|nr:hypothetical protein QBC32DRAFT_366485 [Pseudoneurospora amorphoporcata]